MVMATMNNKLQAQFPTPQRDRVKIAEHQLEDVMEIIDTVLLKRKLAEAEHAEATTPGMINTVRLGILYHEMALNFFSDAMYKGYSGKSYEILTEVMNMPGVPEELLPFVASYRASALSLVSGQTKKLSLLGDAFTLFEDAVKKYAAVCYAPEFMRGSVAENLPWIFFRKKRFAKRDFQSIIDKQQKDMNFANWKIMSFTYWARAKQFGSKHRIQAIQYLDKAIELDPNYQAGRQRAEALKAVMKK